jgi:hypothetical protein
MTMKCATCLNEATTKYPNGDLCNSCFIDMLCKRIQKETKAANPFNANERVLVFGKLAKAFLEKAIGLPLQINEATEEYTKKTIDKEFPGYDKIVVPWTANDEAELFYTEMTKMNPNMKNIGSDRKFVKLFKSITDKELIQAAKILGIEFQKVKRSPELEKIHAKYPSSIFGLGKSAEEFKKALR